jgi:hypothetical protein
VPGPVQFWGLDYRNNVGPDWAERRASRIISPTPKVSALFPGSFDLALVTEPNR